MNESLTWSNWSGSVTSNPASLAAPATVEELQSVIRTSAGLLRVRGAGHSFTPLVASAGTIISLDKLAGMRSHDRDKNQATFAAGTRLGDLTTALEGIGQALANMGDIDKQSIAGALGTATHGTGSQLGAYHTLVDRVELVDGKGEILSFERGKHGDILNAIGVALGVFGVLTEVTLNNLPSYRLKKRRWAVPLGDMLSGFGTLMTDHRSAEFFVVPHSAHAIFVASDITDQPVTQRPADSDEEGLRTLRLLRSGLGWLPLARRALIRNAVRRMAPEDYVEDWLRAYTSDRRTRFNEMEYHLPIEEGPKAIAKIVELTEKAFPEVYFPIEVRTVASDEFWLSPFYKRPTCSIAIHHDARENPLPFFKAAEPVFRKYGGRPHWGKMHTLTAPDLRALYPRFDEAMEVRRDIDPDGRFVTPYIADLLGLR
jgi:FAD-linked oxidoreductase